MVVNFNAEYLFDGFFYRLDPRVAKLDHLSGIRHNDVVMLLVKIRLLVMALVLAKLVAAHQPAVQQQLYGVVERSAANAVVLVLHLDIQRLNVKMLLAVVYLLKNRVAFGGFAVAFIFQEFRKNIFYNFLVLIVFHKIILNNRKDNPKISVNC